MLEYKKWKRKNVTLRGVQTLGSYNGGYCKYGKGIYSACLSNKAMAREYGKVYFILNAIPKNPKKVNTVNDAELFLQKVVHDYCIRNNIKNDLREFDKYTTYDEQVLKLGYDGLIIKGREMVKYEPENILYFGDEIELKNYYLQNIEGEL